MTARSLGRLQSRLLVGLRAHAGEVCLEHLSYFAAGIAELDDPLYWRKGPKPTRSTYKSTQRAIKALGRRNLVSTHTVGTRREAPVWNRDGAGGLTVAWHFKHPSTCALVKAAPVETSPEAPR